MTAGDLAAVVVTVVSIVAIVAFVLAVTALRSALIDLRATIDDLRELTVPAVEEMRETLGKANVEIDRVDNLLDTAASITARVDSASRMTHRAMSTPVIKVMALGAGTKRAARRLKRDR